MTLRLLVYDRTCTKYGFGLSTAWSTGSRLYRTLDRLDATFGASSWSEALAWLGSYEPTRTIREVQYWGHGRWGRVLVDNDTFDASVFREGHALHAAMRRVRERLTPDALWWLRTCEAFGASIGHDFAMSLADGLGVRVAGHTFIIGAVQSGLRTLQPGKRPTWSNEEGLAEGSADDPKRAFGSGFKWPRTITCFNNQVPKGWFDQDGSESKNAKRIEE